MTNNPTRYHGLDALRAFAMVMGVVLHASMFYVEGIGTGLGYKLSGRILTPTSEVLGIVFFFIHTWRMPVFFLLAGFFARLMVQKRGALSLLKNRAVRIVIPLVTCVLIYNLVLKFGGVNELHHLWFLYDLIWMYLLLVLIEKAVRIWPRVVTTIDRLFGSAAKLWWLMIVLLPATTIARPGFFNWINTDLGVPGPFFILGFTYLVIGWFIHRNTHILEELAASWKRHAILGSISFAAFLIIGGAVIAGELNEKQTGLLWLLGLVISPFTTFLMIIGFIGASQAIFQRRNGIISYFVDASYWIYLLHLVIVFAIAGEILRSTSLNPVIAVLLNIFLTTSICLGTYHVLARYTPIGWILHGRKGHVRNMFKPFS